MTNQSFVDQSIKSYHLIFNPVSGPGDPGSKLTEIQTNLESLVNLTVRLIEPDVRIEELAQQAVAEGADAIIAAGGDGTVSGVASVLVDKDITLGIIPSGTANAFATTLGIPENVSEACDIIKTGHHQKVDTARCNGRMMLLAASIGLEADMLERMEREEKSRLGKLAILINSLRELRELEQFEVHLETPENTWHESATAVTVANTATKTMVLAQGPADITAADRNLSITLVIPGHGWGVLRSAANLFFSALRQRSIKDDAVRSCKAKSVKVTADPPQIVFVDGEPFGKTPITVENYPRSLNVIMPKGTT